jgi:hypothetical protein
MHNPLPNSIWANYLQWMLMTAVFVIAMVGLFNTFIDPLGVFGSPRFALINAIKPHLDHHRELARYQRATRLCANSGIFGNSRAEIGFDPDNPAFAEQRLSAFNHAIPGTGASTSLRQIIWLENAKCLPHTIFLGIDFFDFLGGSAPRQLPTLATDPAPHIDARFFAESVFSITGLRDSLTTFFLQRSRYPATSTDHGFNPLFNYIPEVAQNGHYVLFRQRAEENAHNWLRKPMQLRPKQGGISDDEALLDAILRHAAIGGSTTYLIIYPYHAEIRIMIERLGMGQLFADWKRLVVGIAENSIEQGGDVQVWDFSGVSPETLEAIPAKGDSKTHLAHYWEAGHFKKELGDLVIYRLLGKQSNFGIRLDNGNIENWLSEDRHRVQSLLHTPSPLLHEVDELLAKHK